MSVRPGRLWVGPSIAVSKRETREGLQSERFVRIEVLDPQDARSYIYVEDLQPGESYPFTNPGPTGSLTGRVGRTREGTLYVR